MKKETVKKISAAACGLVALIILSYVLLHLPFVQRKLLVSLQDNLRENLGLLLTVDAFDYNLLNLEFHMEGIRLERTEEVKLPPLLQASSARIEMSFLSILNRSYQVEHLEFVDPEVRIFFDRDGNNNLPSKSPTEKVSQSGEYRNEVIFHSAIVKNGALHYKDENYNRNLQLSGIQGSGNWKGGGLHSFRLENSLPGLIGIKGESYPLEGFLLQGDVFRTGVDIEKLLMASGKNNFSFSGSIENLVSPVIDGQGNILLDLDMTKAFTSFSGHGLAGQLNCNYVVSGPVQNLSIDLRSASRNLAYGQLNNLHLDSVLSWENQMIKIQSLEIKDGTGHIKANGFLHPIDWSRGNQLNLEWEELDLDSLGIVLDNPYPLSSFSTGFMDLSWDGLSLEHITGHGEIMLSGKNVRAKPANGLEVTGKILASFDSRGVQATFKDFTLPGSGMKGEILIARDGISGDFDLETQSLAKMFPLFSAFTGELDEERFRDLALDGPASVNIGLTGSFTEPVIKLDVKSSNLQILGLNNIGVQGSLAYDGSSVSMDSMEVWDDAGQIMITGEYPGKYSGLPMRFEVEGKHLPLDKIIRLTGFPLEASGLADVTATIEGQLASPLIQAQGYISEGSLYGQAIGNLEYALEYRNSKLVLDKLSMDGPPGFFDAGGFYDSSRQEFSVHLKADSFHLKAIQFPGVPTPLSANLDIDLTAEGSFENPDIKAIGSLKQLTAGSNTLGNFPFDLQSEGDSLAFHIDSPSFSSSLDGSLSLVSPRILQAKIVTDQLGFEAIRNRFRLPEAADISGLLTSNVGICLDLANPKESLEIEAGIKQIQFRKGEYWIQNKNPVLISHKKGTSAVENLFMAGSGLEIEAGGSINFQKPSLPGIWIKTNVNLSLLNEFFPDVETSGSLRVDSEIQGFPGNPRVSAQLDFSDTRLQYHPVPIQLEDIQSRIRMEDNVIKIDSLSMRLADSSISMKGSVPMEALPLSLPGFLRVNGHREANIETRFLNLDPALLKPLYSPKTGMPLKGTLSGTLYINGPQLTPKSISARARFSTLALEIPGSPLEQTAMTELQLENGVLSTQKIFLESGKEYLDLRGKVNLYNSKETELSLEGSLDLGRLNTFSIENIYSGTSRFKLDLRDSYPDPSILGFIDIQQGRIQRPNLQILVNQLHGQIKFMGDRVEIEKINGFLNGGELVLSGNAGIDKMTFHDIDLKIKTKNSVMNFPEGLKSLMFGDLRLAAKDKNFLLSGKIDLSDARYTENFNVASSLSGIFGSAPARDLHREPDTYLEKLLFDINIGSIKNITLDNNISEAQINAQLKLSGSAYRPVLAGRLQVAEGGKLYFNQNTFAITQGSVDFTNPSRIEPDINISAETEIQDYDIRLVLQGVPDRFTAILSSTPSLSEQNIISLLVTGRTIDSSSSSLLNAAGTTALSFINNALTGKIETAAARVLGLESVRIDSGLISTEENPGARITLGQNLSRDFDLVYSQSLSDARNRMWMTNYKPFERFNIQGVKRDENEYNLAFSHELLFGSADEAPGINEKKPEKQEKLMGNLILTGNTGLPSEELIKALKWESGKSFSHSKMQDSLDRIRKLYRNKGYLSFSLNHRTETANDRINLIINVESGPEVILSYRGYDLPGKLHETFIETWSGSSFSQLAREDMAQKIKVHLYEKGFYQAAVKTWEEQGEQGKRIILFDILKGPEYDSPIFNYEGNQQFTASEITAYLRGNGLIHLAFHRPLEIRRHIEDLYGAKSFLRPEIKAPVIRFSPATKKVYVDISIQEGSPFLVDHIIVTGAGYFEKRQIMEESGIRPGEILLPQKYNLAADNIVRLYQKDGFNDVRVNTEARVNAEKGTVDLEVSVEEGSRWVVEDIRISGNSLTDQKIIQRELKLKKGDKIYFRKINESRKQLYDLGIFDRVNIKVSPLPVTEPDSSGDGENQVGPLIKQCVILVEVNEIKPYRLRYGLQYDTETEFGIMASLVDRNFLGSAYLFGSSFRLNQDERDARAFFRSPQMFGNRINTEIYLFKNKLFKPAFDVDRTGFTLQQQTKFGKSNLLSYNYSLESIDTFYPRQVNEGVLKTTENSGSLNFALITDTRDDILNATRGFFLSNDIRYAPDFLGSNSPYIRYFGQFNVYKSVARFLTYASSIRIGLGKGFSDPLPASEKFFAGGGTTIRGFKKDELGPRDEVTDQPLGGDAVFILNQELRSTLYKRFGAAAFLDFGNVYSGISDFDPTDIRKTAGFGLRLQIPFVLIRLDWGFKLDRLPGESKSQIFFSIGQAF